MQLKISEFCDMLCMSRNIRILSYLCIDAELILLALAQFKSFVFCV